MKYTGNLTYEGDPNILELLHLMQQVTPNPKRTIRYYPAEHQGITSLKVTGGHRQQKNRHEILRYPNWTRDSPLSPKPTWNVLISMDQQLMTMACMPYALLQGSGSQLRYFDIYSISFHSFMTQNHHHMVRRKHFADASHPWQLWRYPALSRCR